jgi:hypothetical protein
LRNADPYTLYTDEGAAGQQAATDSFDAAGGVTAGSAMIPKPSNALAMGIKAYHGSPHSFDKFSMDKIGTGEGAQAYGHGLYFAEQEDIARSYRDALSPKKVAIGGEMVDSPTFFKAARRSPSVDDNIAMLTKQRENILKEQSQYTSDPELGDFVSELYDTQLKDVDREIAELSQYKGGWFGTRPGGSMYEVNIDADPNAFLDWDKPFANQDEVERFAAKFDSVNPSIRKRIEDWGYERERSGQPMPDGNDLVREVFGGIGSKEAKRGQEMMKEAGIPGIKYLDAGSRVPSAMAKKELADWQAQLPFAEKELADATARGDRWLISRKQAEVQRVRDGISRVSKEADGTRNYVVFDDKLISIVKKYGIAGASAMLGYNLLEGMNPAQADELKRIEAGK